MHKRKLNEQIKKQKNKEANINKVETDIKRNKKRRRDERFTSKKIEQIFSIN